jgi:hypothetical protein
MRLLTRLLICLGDQGVTVAEDSRRRLPWLRVRVRGNGWSVEAIRIKLSKRRRAGTMSGLAMILAATMVVPASEPEKVSGEMVRNHDHWT